jgi:type IV secretory pathway VirJ component
VSAALRAWACAFSLLCTGVATGAEPPRGASSITGADHQPAGDDTAEQTHLLAGRFGTVTVYIPEGTPQSERKSRLSLAESKAAEPTFDNPSSVSIFLSGDGGWHLGVINMAKSLTEMGAVVIGVDVTHYLSALRKAADSNPATCQSLAVDLENLSHRIQKEIGMSEYHVPVLVGYSSGATVVYAALVQSPPGTFAGALSLGFCADQDFGGAALCPGAGLHYFDGRKWPAALSARAPKGVTSGALSSPSPSHKKGEAGELIMAPARTLQQPWIALQGQQDQVCAAPAVDEFAAQTNGAQVIRLPKVGHGFGVERNWLPQFREAYQSVVARLNEPRARRPPQINDLPVNEVPAQTDSDQFALLLTGDGGWAGLDQELAARLAASGVPTVGLNSLKYFWTERTPEQTAEDVARILRHYLAAWNKKQVLLVGYSFGADVLPFVVNRLPADLRAKVATISLLGLDSNASFEVTVADWLGSEEAGPPTRPELAHLGAIPVLCIYGEGEKDTLCPSLPPTEASSVQVGSGHHFSGDYSRLADSILGFVHNSHRGLDKNPGPTG